MRKILSVLFLAFTSLGATAQNLTQLRDIVEGPVPESSMLIARPDTTECLAALGTEAGYQESLRHRARLTYPSLLPAPAAAPAAQGYSLMGTSTTGSGEMRYKPLDDISWVGVPLFVAGIIAKSEKEAFRQDYKNSPASTRLLTNFKTRIDDYTQFFSPALTLGLKVGGVEGRSDWQRMLVSAAMSYGIMAGFVNGIKYTASEMRPDGSTANSWPSGHTATAFVGATILHKEYGLTRSPWFSVLGYGTATATGIMRVLNNRHWVSDVLSGAGIGIMSGELAYMLSDLIYKDRHIVRGPLTQIPDLSRKHPSFFDVSMGIGFGSKEIDFTKDNPILIDDEENIKLNFRSATAVQVEGAYFINNFIGVGGRLRVRSSPIKGWSNFMKLAEDDVKETMETLMELDSDPDIGFNNKLSDLIENKRISIESDHLTEFAGDVGLYFNIPITDRLAIGSKALIGRSIMQSLDIEAEFAGKAKGMDYDITIRDGDIYDFNILNFYDRGYSYSKKWDYLSVSGDNSTKWGTGISLTYAYRGNFCWKIFCDYDYTRKTYTLKYDPEKYLDVACPEIASLNAFFFDDSFELKQKKDMHQFVVGASLSIQF